MGAHQAGIEHEIFVAAILGKHCKDALPHTGFSPAREALMDALPLAISLRKIAPARPRTDHPQHPVNEHAIIFGRAPAIPLLAR